MRTAEISPGADRNVRALIYNQLGLSPEADLGTVLMTVANTSGQVDDDVRAGGVLLAVSDEIMSYSTRSNDPEANRAFDRALSSVRYLPLEPDSVRKLDQDLFGLCLDILQAPDRSPQQKAATELMSLNLGADQLGGHKSRMIMEQYRQADAEKRRAIDAYLGVAGLRLEAVKTPSQLEAGLSRAADTMRGLTGVSRQRAGAAALVGIFGFTGLTATPAAADAAMPRVSVAAGMGAIETSDSLRQLEEFSAKAAASAYNSILIAPGVNLDGSRQGTIVKLQLAEPEPVYVTVSASVGNQAEAKLAAPPVKLVSEAETETLPEVAVVPGMATPEPEAEPRPSPVPGVNSQPPVSVPAPETPAPPKKIEVDGSTPEVTTETPTEVPVEPSIDDTKPETAPATPSVTGIAVPDNNVNVAPNETPQQAIERLINSRDIKATSYAIREIYGVDGVNRAPVNDKLVAAIDGLSGTVKQQILDAKHDEAYTNKALLALAYLDAAAKNPTILDHQEVVDFINSLDDLGEDYHNRIYQPYLADAAAKLISEDLGALSGIDESDRGFFERAYAFTAFAAVSEVDQNTQIQTIKDAEAAAAKKAAEEAAQKAAEEDAARQAQEEAAKSAGTLSPESQALQEMIDRAADDNQQRTFIAFKYFIDHGFTPEQATGIIGNLLVETAGTMNPGIKQGGGGPGRGIAQWGSWNKDGSIGGRFATLKNFADAQGKPWDDLTAQLDFIMYEFSGGENKAFSKVKEAQEPRSAAYAFMHWYERPRDQGDKATDIRTNRGTPFLEAYHQAVDRVNQERAAVAAARKAAEEEAAHKAAEEEAARKAAEAEKYGVMTSGQAIANALEAKYGGISGKLGGEDLVSIPGLYKNGAPMAIVLNAEAAQQFQKLRAAFEEHFGYEMRITDGYRSYDAQVRTKENKGKFAAAPGESNHGWGLALDLASGIADFGSETHQWMRDTAPKYGWVNPRWAHDGKGIEEPWHWEYTGSGAAANPEQGISF